MEQDQSQRQFFRCECGCHGVVVDLFDWGNIPEEKRYQISISFWFYANGIGATYSLWERIKHAYALLVKGRVCGEEVLIGDGDIRRLIGTLQEYLPKIE